MSELNFDSNSRRLSIDELERLLDKENSWDDDRTIEILPNGEIRAENSSTDEERGGCKPLTFRENLGGEYAAEIYA